MKCPVCRAELNLKTRSVEELCWMAERLQARNRNELADIIWDIAEDMENDLKVGNKTNE